MDVLSDLLLRARARGAVFGTTVARGDWALSIEDGNPLVIHTVTQGQVWLSGTSDPVLLQQGDLALVRKGGPQNIGSSPRVLPTPIETAARLWGTSTRRLEIPGTGDQSTVTCGAYLFDGALCQSLLDSLPEVVHLTATEVAAQPALATAVRLLSDEVERDDAGQQAVLDRLLDILLVCGLRAWFARNGDNTPLWYRAALDPPVGKALQLMHQTPAKAWTVAELGEAVLLSRATFARRFTQRVGKPPLEYLTDWRLQLAADLLTQTSYAVDRVAREVGYASAPALSTAFRRHHGIAPAAYRRTARHH